jgi:hypothetical protein
MTARLQKPKTILRLRSVDNEPTFVTLSVDEGNQQPILSVDEGPTTKP